jgi:hypothetical protein
MSPLAKYGDLVGVNLLLGYFIARPPDIVDPDRVEICGLDLAEEKRNGEVVASWH